jgi:hypothetical protein
MKITVEGVLLGVAIGLILGPQLRKLPLISKIPVALSCRLPELPPRMPL